MRSILLSASLVLATVSFGSGLITVASEPQHRIQVDLSDGSRVIGLSNLNAMKVHVGFDELSIPLSRIFRVEYVDQDDAAVNEYQVRLSNGDLLSGDLRESVLRLETIFGNVELAKKHVLAIEVIDDDGQVLLPIRKGLVVYYGFDRVGDGIVVNQAGQGHDAKMSHLTVIQPNDRRWSKERAVRVQRTSRMQVAHDQELCPQEISIGAWMYFDTPASGYEMIAAKTNQSSWNGGYGLYRVSNNSVHFFVNRYSRSTVKADPLPKTWNHILATYKDGKIGIYLNGVLAQSSAVDHGQPISHVETPLCIGADGNHSAWNGMLDDFVFYDRALTPTEIERLYQHGKRRFLGLDAKRRVSADPSVLKAMSPQYGAIGLSPNEPVADESAVFESAAEDTAEYSADPFDAEEVGPEASEVDQIGRAVE